MFSCKTLLRGNIFKSIPRRMLCSIPKKFCMLLVFVPAERVLDLHPRCLNQVLVYSRINSLLFPDVSSPGNCSSNTSAESGDQHYRVSLSAHQGPQ